MKIIKRTLEQKVLKDMKIFPAVAILGPRQCGKSTLAKVIGEKAKNFIYIDLEKPGDFQKVLSAELFFEANRKNIVCIDEVQLLPNLFSLLRSEIDTNRKNGRFIFLGSASRELLQKSSQTLAGRIGYLELSPFTVTELVDEGKYDYKKHWLMGGYPQSYLVKDNVKSKIWLENFISTYLERDIPMLGIGISSFQLKRFILMITGVHGQLVNLSKLGDSMNLSHSTIRTYLDLFEQCYLVRVLHPYEKKINKRLVRTPKLYFRDSGILHSLLNISSFNELLGNIVLGASWEGYALENILTAFPEFNHSFYRTATGEEIDLVLEKGNKKIAVEFKASMAPQLTKGFWIALNDLEINEAYIVAPINESYELQKNVWITNIYDCIKKISADKQVKK